MKRINRIGNELLMYMFPLFKNTVSFSPHFKQHKLTFPVLHIYSLLINLATCLTIQASYCLVS